MSHARFMKVRKVALWVGVLLWVAWIFLVFIPGDQHEGLIFVCGLMIFMYVGFLPWLQGSIPPDDRKPNDA